MKMHTLLPLAALAGLALTANAATIAGDGIASFDIGNQIGSGDITNNPNGLAITGQSGAWASITTGTPSATDDGVTLTFNGGTVPVWGGTAGDNRGTGSTDAIRLGTFLSGPADISWTISGLTANAFYDMIWYNKRVSPGETRHPNTGVTGFDAGNGVGASGPLDGDLDQNFIGVQANGSGNISGTWFLAGGTQDITAVTGVQIKFVSGGGADVTPPAITSRSPINGAIDVPTNANLVATFSEDVMKVAGSTGEIRIWVVGGGSPVQTIPVSSGDVTVSGKDLTIDPNDLLDSTGYYVEIDNGAIEDLAGNDFPGISGDTTWSFTTATPDNTAPSIDTLAPSNGETDVAIDTSLVATFDEDVKKGTGNIVIRESDGTEFETIPVASVTIDGAEVTITPGSDLANETGYYVEIDSGAIEDLAGNDFGGIAGDGTWSFTTLAPRAMTTVLASFNLGGGSVSGDVPAANNPNGLLMTGTVGAWPTITTGTPSATSNGVTLTFTATAANWGGTVGDSRGNGVGTSALRIGTFVTTPVDVPWTITGLTPNAFYDMIWYNKRESPGETRHPNSGVAGFDAGNGVGASGPLDADRDQDFIGVQADATGAISGTWFLAGGAQDITAVAGVQIGASTSGGPTTFELIITPNGADYDFTWASQSGKLYDLVSSTGLSTPVSTWPVWEGNADIAGTAPSNTLVAVAAGPDPTRFFAVLEKDPPPLLDEDFESDNGGFTISKTAGTDWEHGAPISNDLGGVANPGGSVTEGNGGSTNCWGTDIGNPGFYADPTTDSCLRSPNFDLTGASAAELTFAEALDLAPGDTAVVQLINAAGDVWIADVYTATDGDVSSADWADANGGTPIDLSAGIGNTVYLQWCFTGNGGDDDDYMGWYIDDVVVTVP